MTAPTLLLISLGGLALAGALVYVLHLNHRLRASRRALLEALQSQGQAQAELEARLAELDDSEEKFARLARSARDGIVLLDDFGRVVFWNPAATRIFGFTEDEARGRAMHEWLAPESARAPAASGYTRFRRHGRGPLLEKTQELTALHRDGSMVSVELSVSAVQLGGRWHALGLVRDISERKAQERALRLAKERAELYLESAGALMLALDLDARVERVNGRVCETLGCTPEEILGADWLERVVVPEARPRMRRLLADLAGGGAGARRQTAAEALARDGGRRAIRWELTPVVDHGRVTGFLCSGLDVTEHLRLEASLRSIEASLTNLVDRNRSGMLVLDRSGRVRFANSAAHRALRAHGEQLVGEVLGVPAAGTATEIDILREDGTHGVGELTVTETEWEDELAYLVMLHDVTQRKAVEERARFLAEHDGLTGLPNRVLLMDRLEQAVSRGRRGGQGLAVLFLDLDGFKWVNDNLGHDAGDALLRAVADRLSAGLRASDTVARLGGDEFVVLSEQLSAPADALTVADKVQAALAPPVELSGQAVTVGASVGISLYPEDGTDADTLLRKADTAMYDAKRAGGRRVCLYGEQLSAAAGEGGGFAGGGAGR